MGPLCNCYFFNAGGGSVSLEHLLPCGNCLLEQVGRGDVWPGKHPRLLWGSRALSHATAASGGGGGHVARPEVAESVYLWSYKKVNVFYIVEIGIDI